MWSKITEWPFEMANKKQAHYHQGHNRKRGRVRVSSNMHAYCTHMNVSVCMCVWCCLNLCHHVLHRAQAANSAGSWLKEGGDFRIDSQHRKCVARQEFINPPTCSCHTHVAINSHFVSVLSALVFVSFVWRNGLSSAGWSEITQICLISLFCWRLFWRGGLLRSAECTGWTCLLSDWQMNFVWIWLCFRVLRSRVLE